MSDRVYKLIELIGSSSASIDDAVHCPSTFDRALTPSDHTREIPPLTNDRAPR